MFNKIKSIISLIQLGLKKDRVEKKAAKLVSDIIPFVNLYNDMVGNVLDNTITTIQTISNDINANPEVYIDIIEATCDCANDIMNTVNNCKSRYENVTTRHHEHIKVLTKQIINYVSNDELSELFDDRIKTVITSIKSTISSFKE